MKSVIEFHTEQTPTVKTNAKTGEDMHVFDCPFCGKEGHFFYFPKNTVWDCKVCGKKGNNYGFIRELYAHVCISQTGELAKKWGLPNRVLEKLKFNPLNQTFVIPTFRNDKLNNLYKITTIRKQDKNTHEWYDAELCLASPGLPTTLMDWSDDTNDTLWLCEGQKDKLAADAILGLGRDITAIGVPGAATFREGWTAAFQDKDLVIIYDNDKAGEEGKKKVIDAFTESPNKPKSIKVVIWPEDKPTGYDLRDFYKENKSASFKMLEKLWEPVEVSQATKVTVESVIEDYSCDSYDKALDAYQDAYHITQDTKAAMALVMASIYSLNIDGEQLWLKVIGPPGCGKSTIAKAISASEHVVNLSTFTGLFSGWRDGEGKDQGLVPLISGKTLIVKDADALLRQPNVEQIFSELRDFYDKDSSVRYRHGVSFEYQDVRSTFIMLGTQVLRRADQSFLGERLLTVEMDVSKHDKTAISSKVMERGIAVALGKKVNPTQQIMSSLKGWLNHLRDRKLDTEIPPDFQKSIIELCSFTALMRTQVDRNFKGQLQSPAIPELPSRLIGQAITATLSLSAVFGRNKPDEEIHSIIRKIMRDTVNPRSHRFLICDTILENPGISAHEVMEATSLDQNTVGEQIRDLLELKFCDTRPKPSTQNPSRKVAGYFLKPEIEVPMRDIT